MKQGAEYFDGLLAGGCSCSVPARGLNMPRFRQCRRVANASVEGVPFCSAHDPRTVEKREREKSKRFYSKRNLRVAQELAKIQNKFRNRA